MDSHDSRPPAVPGADGDPRAPHADDHARWRRPQHHVRVCLLDPCQALGGRELTQTLVARLGIQLEERTADGRIALEGLECIGLCDIGQAAMIDDEPVVGRDAVIRAVDQLLR